MPVLVELIAKYANYLYVICALLLVPFLNEFQRARLDRRSIFPLEKENATKRLRRALFGMFLVVGIAGGVFYISSYVEPTIVEVEETPTPTFTVSILNPTPTGTPAPPTEVVPTVTPTATRRVPPTPPPVEPTATPTPLVIAPDCPNPGVRITSPGVNAVLDGPVEVYGSASIDNFEYYKFEYQSADGQTGWITYDDLKGTPVTEGFLGVWNVSSLPSGPYLFRLVVVDATGNYPPPCQVRVSVQH